MPCLRGCGGGEKVIRKDLTPRAFLLMEEEVLVMPLRTGQWVTECTVLPVILTDGTL